jgi:hypothetical protein
MPCGHVFNLGTQERQRRPQLMRGIAEEPPF